MGARLRIAIIAVGGGIVALGIGAYIALTFFMGPVGLAALLAA